MKKKYYNYFIFFALIFLVAFSFIKKNNFIIFTISPIGSYQLRNIDIINSELERYFLLGYLHYIEKKFNQFYIDDYTYNEINKIYSDVKIINKKRSFTVIINDNKKKIEDIERIEMLLNNFLLNQNTIMIHKLIEKIPDKFGRMGYKYNRKEADEAIEGTLLYYKLLKEIKNKYVKFFKILNEF